MQYRADIDGIRALAILAVVLHHAFPTLLPGGYAGVDVFFVISGFLIGYILYSESANDSFSLTKFYIRRIRRLFPALILMICASLTIGLVYLSPSDLVALSRHSVAATLFLPNILSLFDAGYFDVESKLKPMLHLWSLGIEEQFYLAWPIITLIGFKIAKKTGVLTAVVILLSLSLILCFFIPQNLEAKTFSFFSPFTRIWELLVGVLAAVILYPNAKLQTPIGKYQEINTSGKIKFLLTQIGSATGLALIAITYYFANDESRIPGVMTMSAVLGTLLLILTPTSLVGRLFLATRPMVGIGLVSYAWYIWHWPFLSFARIFFQEVSMPVTLMLLVGSLIFAILTYIYVEQFFRRRSSVRVTVCSLIAAMIVLSASATVFIQFDGLTYRVPEIIRQPYDPTNRYQYPALKACFNSATVENKRYFPATCTASSRKFNIALWGDSNAAMLVQPLAEMAEKTGIGLSIYTASACPAIINFGQSNVPFCQASNQEVFDTIVRRQPDIVFLHTRWRKDMIPTFQKSLQALQSQYKGKIVFIGVAPQWRDQLARIFMNHYRDHPTDPIFPEFDGSQLEPSLFTVENKYRQVLTQFPDITYVSILSLLCRKQTCRTRFGTEVYGLTSPDHQHLSLKAARYVVKELIEPIISFQTKLKPEK